jgi:hypothetical protein
MATDNLFRPENGSSLIATARAMLETHGFAELHPNAHEADAFITGNAEGELGFAIAAARAGSAAETIYYCKAALLSRLGLVGDSLSIEQTRTRGWLVGMFTSLEAAFEPEGMSE